MEFLHNGWVMLGLFVAALAIGAVLRLKMGGKKDDGGSMQLNSAAIAGAAALAVFMFSLPTLSIDIEGIFTYAFDIVNAFMPLIAIVAGLGLGFNLVTKIGALFQRAL